MLNNRFFTLKKLNWLMFTITMILSFRMIFPRNTHIFKTKWLINKPLKQRTDLILKQIESSRRLNTD